MSLACNAPARRVGYSRTVDDSTQRGGSREALIVAALSEVFRMLGEVQNPARQRELRAQARFYDQAIKHWTTVPPTYAQLDAMFDLVTELHGNVATAGRRRT